MSRSVSISSPAPSSGPTAGTPERHEAPETRLTAGTVVLRLTADAPRGLGARLQAALGDRETAVHALAVGALLSPGERLEHFYALAAQRIEGRVDPVGVGQARSRVGRVVFGLRVLLQQDGDGAIKVGE